jgi:hypothetical protein
MSNAKRRDQLRYAIRGGRKDNTKNLPKCVETIRYRLLNELTSTQTVKNKRLCIGGFYSVLYQYFYIATV